MNEDAAEQRRRTGPWPSSSAPSRTASAGPEDDDGVYNARMADEEQAALPRAEQKRRRQRKGVLEKLGDGQVLRGRLSLADLAVLKKSATNALLIGLWYFFSVSISVYNKWMFSKENLNFQFPLFTTCLHMIVQFSLASLVLFLMPRFRPRQQENGDALDTSDEPHEHVRSKKKPLMTPRFYLSRLGPCGAATGLDIGLGNMSMRFISLTFFTMCKSSVLAFVLLWAFAFRLETPSVKLVLIVTVMTVGVLIMVAGETAFNLVGFCLIISSAFCSGFRWALTQILLLRNPATGNPFSSIFFLAPVMFLSLFVLAVPIEGFGTLAEGLRILTAQKGTLVGILLLIFPGTLAFCMVASEFALLQRTSVVTLSICGIFKEIVMITTSELVYKDDKLTPINVGGLLITISAIATYNYIKIVKMRQKAEEALKGGTSMEEEPMLQEPEQSRTGEAGFTSGRLSPPKRSHDLE